MSAATPLDYAARCERYARQRGWAYDPARTSIEHLTPRQKRRALKKESGRWPAFPDDGPYNEGFGIDDYDDGTAAVVRAIADSPAVREEVERRFLGDVTHWKPTGLLQPSRPSQQEEPS